MRTDTHIEASDRRPNGGGAPLCKHGLLPRQNLGILNIRSFHAPRAPQSVQPKAIALDKVENHLISSEFAKPSDDPVFTSANADGMNDKRAKSAAATKTIRFF